ncbi:hypothetical protein [Fortiea sp. LEGE XX443]|nr:hypothetical protein [Fortiea sp. LEGE XX443]
MKLLIHISIPQRQKQAIDDAIADGQTPAEIEKLIHSWREEK